MAVRKNRGVVVADPTVAKAASKGFRLRHSGDKLVHKAPRLFKFTKHGGIPTHGYGMAWPLPTKNEDGSWTPSAWQEVQGEVIACSNGLHATVIERIPDWWSDCLFEVEVEGPVILADGNKYVARKMRLVRRIESWDFSIAMYGSRPDTPDRIILRSEARMLDRIRRMHTRRALDARGYAGVPKEVALKQIEIERLEAQIGLLKATTDEETAAARFDIKAVTAKKRGLNPRPVYHLRSMFLHGGEGNDWHLSVAKRDENRKTIERFNKHQGIRRARIERQLKRGRPVSPASRLAKELGVKKLPFAYGGI